MKVYNLKTFFSYVIIVASVMMSGVALAMVHGYIIHPDLQPLNATELHSKHIMQSQTVIPHLQKIFPLLTIFNIGVAFIILMFPLYWIMIAKYSSNILSPSQVPMKATVYFLILAVGHNTFFVAYPAWKTIPLPVFLTMYYPHAFLEILVYILAGTFSLLCIDDVRNYFSTHQSIQDLHPGDISLMIFHRTGYVFIIIIVLLIIAGAIECYVTPRMVLDMMNIYY